VKCMQSNELKWVSLCVKKYVIFSSRCCGAAEYPYDLGTELDVNFCIKGF
jgi:hypothetical protein